MWIFINIFVILIIGIHSEDKAEVNIRVSGACSPSKSNNFLILFNLT